MKHLKLFAVIMLLAFSLTGFAQKVKCDDNVAYIDDKEYVKYEGGGMMDNSLSISSLAGDELVYVQIINPGQYFHAKIIFVGLEGKTLEMSSNNYNRKKLIKLLYTNNVIADGKLDPKKVDVFISKYDEHITKDNNTTTIIIKEEPKKSGININIGN